ncbi:MAG: hypothetical protein JST00_20580 [Deltaproteobacteria bacterium]|nr:hypothetical protein [Deltaproteobacteria bacterium]
MMLIPCMSAIAGAAVPACSSAPDDPSSASASADDVVIDASSETRAALGVARWSIARGASRALAIRGLDDSTREIVRFERSGHAGAELRTTLTTREGRATMSAALAGGMIAKLRDNDFAGNAAARRALALLDADLRSRAGSGTSLTTRAAGAGSITPKQLTNGSSGSSLVEGDGGTTVSGTTGCLAKRCQTAMVDDARSCVAATSACSLLPPDGPASAPCAAELFSADAKQKETNDCSSGGSDAVCRASEWVSAKMPYCGGPKDGPDVICGGTCRREGSAVRDDWNAYRSDCSGLVSWAWGLPPPGKTTLGLAPFDGSVSELTTVDALAPGDALNNANHVMLFAGWTDKAASKATIIEEYDCGKIARESEKTLTKVDDSTVQTSSGTFRTIRHRR